MTSLSIGRSFRLPTVRWHRLGAVDWPLLVAVALAVVIGLAMLYSATLRGGETERAWDDLVLKQVMFAVVGFAILAFVAMTEYRVLLELWPWIYGVTIVLLLALPVFGTELGGAKRWFNLGPIVLQPSELAKIALIICLAAFFERYDVRRARTVLASIALAAVPIALVVRQPDLSTAIMLAAVWLGVLFAAGARPIHLSVLAVLVTPLAVFVLTAGLIKPYQLERITALMDPSGDPLDAGYQNIQTLLAVGNGGLTGTGFAGGLQSQGGWLPLAYTDNIYALVAEELGFLGGVILLALLAFIILRVLRAAGLAQEHAGRLIAVGVASYLLAQTFVNVGVVLQILPVTGMSLPFVSYGGSSLAVLLIAIGLVQSVLLRRKPIDFR